MMRVAGKAEFFKRQENEEKSNRGQTILEKTRIHGGKP
jgi:hypothetical protein